MVESKKVESAGQGNTAVPSHGDHDRVVMLSLRADGTPDQFRPEIIGDPKFAEDAAKRQFTEQAVSAVDSEKRAATAAPAGEALEQDPGIAELQAEHEKAASAAEKAAASVVESLHKG